MGKFTAPQFPYQRQNAIHHNYLQKKLRITLTTLITLMVSASLFYQTTRTTLNNMNNFRLVASAPIYFKLRINLITLMASALLTLSVHGLSGLNE